MNSVEECPGVDPGLDRQVLDYVITRFEVKQLLAIWSNYIHQIEEEIATLRANEDAMVPWGQIADYHREANKCLRSGLTGTPDNFGTNSLDYALHYLLSQLANTILCTN